MHDESINLSNSIISLLHSYPVAIEKVIQIYKLVILKFHRHGNIYFIESNKKARAFCKDCF